MPRLARDGLVEIAAGLFYRCTKVRVKELICPGTVSAFIAALTAPQPEKAARLGDDSSPNGTHHNYSNN